MRGLRSERARLTSRPLLRAVTLSLAASIFAPRMARAEGPGEGNVAAALEEQEPPGSPLVHIESRNGGPRPSEGSC